MSYTETRVFYSSSVAIPRNNAVVSLLKLYKRGPKIIRKAVNAVSVFFRGGLAALRAFSNRKSDEERATHLKISVATKKMNQAYLKQHQSFLQQFEQECDYWIVLAT